MKAIKLPLKLTDFLAKFKAVSKHHYFIFTVLLLCGLTIVVYVVDTTLRSSVDNTYRDQRLSESLKATFDQAIIEKIENLQKSDEASTAPSTIQPGARKNPFAE
jgi:hypothetical protein